MEGVWALKSKLFALEP